MGLSVRSGFIRMGLSVRMSFIQIVSSTLLAILPTPQGKRMRRAVSAPKPPATLHSMLAHCLPRCCGSRSCILRRPYSLNFRVGPINVACPSAL